MGIVRTVLHFAAPLPKLTDYERFLFLGPHPDDIEIGAGATAARLAAEGKQVCFLICTDGRYGTDAIRDEKLQPEELLEIRRWEARDSAAMLGVRDVRMLDLCDGGFYEWSSMLLGVARVVGEFQPDVIFAPDPDTGNECHIDHRNVGDVAKQIALFSGNPGIMEHYGARPADVSALALYMTAKANTAVATAGYLDRQMSALFDCHRSQFPENSEAARTLRIYLKLRAADFGLRCGRRSGEGFRVLGRTQMHCLPEAGL